jgi:hypothetical protein
VLHQQAYVSEKLREADGEAARRLLSLPSIDRAARPRRRLIGPAVRAAGRVVRRTGEALESWAAQRPMPR